MRKKARDERLANIEGTLRVVKFLLRVAAPYRKQIVAAAIMFGVAMVLQLPVPVLTKYLIDHALASRNLSTIDLVGLGLLGVVAAHVFVGLLNKFAIVELSSRVQYDLRMKVLKHVESLPVLFFRKNTVGYLLSRVTGDVDIAQGMLNTVAIELPWSVVTLAIGLGLIFWLNWRLAIICLAFLPGYCAFSLWSGGRARKLASKSREAFAISIEDVENTLSGIEVIKCLNKEDFAARKVARRLAEAIDREKEYQRFVGATIAGLDGLTLFTSLGVLWLGSRAVLSGAFTLGGLMAFMTALRYLFEPAAAIAGKVVDLQRCTASGERLLELLDLPPEDDGGRDLKISEVSGSIEFRNVVFGYEQVRVLNGISFSIAPGEKVAIVGRSGVGKSTIAGLILRLFRPWAGEITIDGIDIQRMKVSCLRQAVAYVPQEAFLFSDSILENIRMGEPSAPEDKVLFAAGIAGLRDLIGPSGETYDRTAGTAGRCLSGGERQRVSIARALVRESPILIFDEATSEVDTRTDAMIQESLFRYCNGRTFLIIAHRLSTAVRADRIMVMDGGRIVDSGSHDELLARCKIYRDLWEADCRSDVTRK